jgi:hypothetical protein
MDMTKHIGSLAVAVLAVALTPESALAEKRAVHINASFTVAFTRTNNTTNATYCGPEVLAFAVAANGAGYSSKLGALFFALQKTAAGAPGIFQGCAAFRSPNGDALYANYAGTNSGGTGFGTLTFTGGTGKFEGATGSATWTGIFVGLYPTLTTFGGGTIPNLQGTAFYLVEGTVYLEKNENKDKD